MSDYLDKKDMTNEQLELYDRGFSFDKDGKIIHFNANFFATFISNKYYFIYKGDGFFYEYQEDEGVWEQVDIKELKAFLYGELQEPRHGVWSTKRETEYIEALKRMVYEPRELNEHRHLINMKNGMFDLESLELIPHNPEYLSSIQIPVTYDEDADCERYKQYLDEVFEGDKERITKAIEWYGYCISTDTKAQKALILYGGGSNGKGIFTDILGKIVGDKNLSHIPLNELHKGFSRATLFGKTVNISTENEMGGKSFNTQYFKAITGEDIINAEFKNKPVFTFKPTAKMVISMNNLPQTKDKSDGYYRRLDFLPFTRHFSEEDKDRDLKAKLESELSGIFNLAIEGLVRLRSNGYKFSSCGASDNLLAEYKQELNPIMTFFDECVEISESDFREDNKVIYGGFKGWAEENGHKGYSGISSQRFWRDFHAEVKRRNIIVQKGRSDSFRYHTGIKIVGDALTVTQRRKRTTQKQQKNTTADLFSDTSEDEAG